MKILERYRPGFLAIILRENCFTIPEERWRLFIGKLNHRPEMVFRIVTHKFSSRIEKIGDDFQIKFW